MRRPRAKSSRVTKFAYKKGHANSHCDRRCEIDRHRAVVSFASTLWAHPTDPNLDLTPTMRACFLVVAVGLQAVGALRCYQYEYYSKNDTDTPVNESCGPQHKKTWPPTARCVREVSCSEGEVACRRCHYKKHADTLVLGTTTNPQYVLGGCADATKSECNRYERQGGAQSTCLTSLCNSATRRDAGLVVLVVALTLVAAFGVRISPEA